MSHNAYDGSLQSDHTVFDSRDSLTFLDNTQDENYFDTSHSQDGLAQDRYLSYQQLDVENDRANTQYHAESNAPNEQFAISADEPHYTTAASPRLSEGTHSIPDRCITSLSSNRATSSAPLHARRGSDNKFRVQKDSHPHKEAYSIPTAQDEQTWSIRERNRQAALRFRMRQKDSVARLKSIEQAVEKRHEELRNHVDSLNKEILCLKMQVLQHTNCDCSPVHHYVEQEAQQYLHSMGPM